MASTLFGGALGSEIIVYNSIRIRFLLVISKKKDLCVLKDNRSNLPSSRVVTVLLGLGLLEPKSFTAITLVVYCVAGFK